MRIQDIVHNSRIQGFSFKPSLSAKSQYDRRGTVRVQSCKLSKMGDFFCSWLPTLHSTSLHSAA